MVTVLTSIARDVDMKLPMNRPLLLSLAPRPSYLLKCLNRVLRLTSLFSSVFNVSDRTTITELLASKALLGSIASTPESAFVVFRNIMEKFAVPTTALRQCLPRKCPNRTFSILFTITVSVPTTAFNFCTPAPFPSIDLRTRPRSYLGHDSSRSSLGIVLDGVDVFSYLGCNLLVVVSL